MKTKIEYLMWERDNHTFDVAVYENDVIIARRHYFTVSDLLKDAARFYVRAPKGSRIVMETRTGKIQEFGARS